MEMFCCRLMKVCDRVVIIFYFVDGGCLLINYARRVLLSHFHFKKRVDDIQFSHDSSMIAVTFGRHIQVCFIHLKY